MKAWCQNAMVAFLNLQNKGFKKIFSDHWVLDVNLWKLWEFYDVLRTFMERLRQKMQTIQAVHVLSETITEQKASSMTK